MFSPQVPALLNRFHATLYQWLRDDDAADLYARWMPFPSLELAFENFSLMAVIGPFCAPLLFTITLPLIVVALVSEKSQRMRQVMVMTGLHATPHWIIAWLWWALAYLLGLVLIYAFAFALKFEFITEHDFDVSFVLYLLYGVANLSFSFFVSTFFNSTRSANIFSIIGLFITVILGQVLSRASVEADAESCVT
jgi:hypothetical protein